MVDFIALLRGDFPSSRIETHQLNKPRADSCFARLIYLKKPVFIWLPPGK